MFDRDQEVRVAGPEHFNSAWMSAGGGEEWVSVDLGATCTFDRIALAWIRRASQGVIQASDDGTQWKTVQALPAAAGPNDDIRLTQPARARYVRVLMTKPATREGRYILSELEVFGRGGPVAVPHAAAYRDLMALFLSPGKLACAARIAGASQRRATPLPGFADKDWMIATVPGTVLTSYLNDGAIPTDFGDNQYAISDSFFCADFWYRDEFKSRPREQQPGEHTWLNFDGINWKAEVYLNGHEVGRIDGGFMRGRFDVTAFVHHGGRRMRSQCASFSVANPGQHERQGWPDREWRRAGARQSHLSCFGRMGLDVHDPRTRHRDLEQCFAHARAGRSQLKIRW